MALLHKPILALGTIRALAVISALAIGYHVWPHGYQLAVISALAIGYFGKDTEFNTTEGPRYMSPYEESGQDAYLAALDAESGLVLWMKTFGGVDDNDAGVDVDFALETVYVTGSEP